MRREPSFGLSKKERVQIRSSYVRKLGFPASATYRFYFRLNYNGRRSHLNFKPGKAFTLVIESIFTLADQIFSVSPKRFYFQLNYRRERSRQYLSPYMPHISTFFVNFIKTVRVFLYFLTTFLFLVRL